jgi:transposase
MSRFIAVDRDTAYLLPPSVDEWLPQDHLARLVVEVIDQLDLSELARQYAGRGSDAYHPGMLQGLLVYGYATGVHSSRKIERACHDSVAFRFIAANTQVCVLCSSLRMRMSSSMRGRSGVTPGVVAFMALLQSRGEADCLTRQLRRPATSTSSRRIDAALPRERFRPLAGQSRSSDGSKWRVTDS